MINPQDVRIVLHGSFRRHFDQILEARQIFTEAGFQVIAPTDGDIVEMTDGFAILKGEENIDPRQIELQFLHHLKNLGPSGFSYFVDPNGYIGRSTSYEIGIAQLIGARCFFSSKPVDHPAYIPPNSIWTPVNLRDYILEHNALPPSVPSRNEYLIHKLMSRLAIPGSIVAVGAIIEHQSKLAKPELLFVKTHKWGGRYSMIGEKVQRGERLANALTRGIKEETNLPAKIGRHLTTFDQFQDSGYYKQEVNHIFADFVVQVNSKQVRLNEEAQDYIWATAQEALKSLDLELNARHTLQLYAKHRLSRFN